MTSTDIAPSIGHNQPPKTPFEIAEDRIETLHVEASNWLDGEAIESQGQADAVSKLLSDARTARKEADAARKVDAKPFDDGKKEVQELYKPLLARADVIADLCKKVLAPFLAKIDAEKKATAERARIEAEETAAKAREAFAKADPTDLAAREEAERYADDAKAAESHAKHTAKDKAAAKGGARAVTLRSVWTGTITDLTATARHYWKTDRAALEDMIAEMVQRDVRAGKRDIPGVEITEERVAV